MNGQVVAEAAVLLQQARQIYDGDAPALAVIDDLAERLDGPLRIAVAGMVKAGKSTLLNAVIGEEIAPTDAGECTRIVTWYRYGATPRVTLHRLAGGHERGAGALARAFGEEFVWARAYANGPTAPPDEQETKVERSVGRAEYRLDLVANGALKWQFDGIDVMREPRRQPLHEGVHAVAVASAGPLVCGHHEHGSRLRA